LESTPPAEVQAGLTLVFDTRNQTCAGSVFGKRSASVARSLSCLSAAAGLTAWAANARSVNSYFDSDAAIYKDTDSADLRAQQQRLLLQYDVFAAVYQFTQVSQPLTARLNLPATLHPLRGCCHWQTSGSEGGGGGDRAI
jgi:hypothetical protein